MKLRVACVVVAFWSLSFSLAPLTLAQTSTVRLRLPTRSTATHSTAGAGP